MAFFNYLKRVFFLSINKFNHALVDTLRCAFNLAHLAYPSLPSDDYLP